MKSSLSLQSEKTVLIQKALRGLIYLCIGLILFWMPIYIDVELKHVFNSAKEILFGRILMVALMAWATIVLLKKALLIPKSRVFYLFSLVIFYMLASILWSVSPNLSYREIAPQLGCFILFWIALTTVRKERVIQWLISFAILSAFLVTMYGLAQYYDFDDKYFTVQQTSVVMDTFAGKIAVPAGESAMSVLLPLPFVSSRDLFHRILLPQKPEETFKIYSFMGHRNYFSGYLVLILPLVILRFTLKLKQLIFSAHPRSVVKNLWDSLSVIFYSVSMISMANAILLTQTRGAILGAVVALCFLVLCSILLSNPDRKKGVTIAVFSALMVVGSLIGGLFLFKIKSFLVLAILASCFFFILFLFFFRQLVSPVLVLIVFLIMALGTYKVIVSEGKSGTLQSHQSTIERISGTSSWKASEHQRTLIYSTTLRIITDNPLVFLFGKGIGTFGIHYMLYQVRLFLDTEVSGEFLWDTNKSIYAHNEYIHWWSEVGLIGLFLILSFFYLYVKRVLYAMLRVYKMEYEENPLKLFTMLGLLAGTIGTLVHCIVTFDLHLMYSMVTFYCWAAFALVLSGVEISELPLLWPTPPVFGVSVLGISLFVWFELSNVYWRDVYWRNAFYYFSVRNWSEAFKLYQQALQHDSTLGELLFDFGRCLMDSNDNPRIEKAQIDHYNVGTIKRNLNLRTMYQRPHDLKPGESLPADADLTDKNLTNNFLAVSSFLEATHNFTDPANFHNIALCFYKESQRESYSPEVRQTLAKKSEDYYRKAIDLNPIYAQSLSNLGYLKALRNEKEEARSMLERAVRLKDGRTPTTYLGLAVVYQQENNFEKALEMFLQLEKLSPDNLETLVRIGSLYQQMDKKVEAEDYFLKAAKVADHPAQREQLERQALMMKIPRLQEVLKKDPKDQVSYVELAYAFVQYGSLDMEIPGKEKYLQQGILALQNLLSANPNDINTRLTLARAYEVIGDRESLLKEWGNVLKIMSSVDPRRSAIQRKLELLR